MIAAVASVAAGPMMDTGKMSKVNALQKIESHEKLCRIMQKQTHDKITDLQNQITRIERILLVSAGALITGMCCVIIMLLN